MIAKVLVLVCLTACLCEAKKGDHYTREIVKEICKDDTSAACKDTVKMCMPPFDEANRAAFTEKRCKILETCLDKVTGARTAFDTFIKEKKNGRDWCKAPMDGKDVSDDSDNSEDSAKPTSVDSKPKPIAEILQKRKERKQKFEEYLVETAQPNMVADFRCCIAKESGKFNADGKVNVAAWKESASKFVDPKAKTAYEAGIDSCVATQTACNMHSFKICVISKCYATTKPSSP